MNSDEIGMCDYCGDEVPYDDLPDCEPDEDNHCIRCGRYIEASE